MKQYTRSLLVMITGMVFASQGSETVEVFSIDSQTGSENILQFNIPEYDMEDVELNGQTFKKLSIDGAVSNSVEGDPELPSITTFYATEPGKTYRAELTIHSRKC